MVVAVEVGDLGVEPGGLLAECFPLGGWCGVGGPEARHQLVGLRKRLRIRRTWHALTQPLMITAHHSTSGRSDEAEVTHSRVE